MSELTTHKTIVFRVQDSQYKIGYIAGAIHININDILNSNNQCLEILSAIKMKYHNSLIIIYIDANQTYSENRPS